MAKSLPDISVPPRLYLLGSFKLERAGDSIRLATHKAESLLAYLALHPREMPHSREKLAALLWGDSPDVLARTSLRRALVILRDALGDDLLITGRETVQINPAYALWVDALEFQSQAELLLKDSGGLPNRPNIDLYRDDLLVDFYDEWISPVRERLRSLYIEVLLSLTGTARDHADYGRAIELAQRVLQREATNETAYQHLMFCFWKTGKRSAALGQFQECQRILERELGVKPSPETIALYKDIRDEASATRRVAETQRPRLPIPLTTFVGRGRELAEIKRLLPTTRLLTLSGAGGSGKTRLAIQAASDLQNDFRDGVGWVDLAKLIDPTLLPHTVAQALGISETADRPLIQSIPNYLLHRHLLLVLDNCEHLVDACAELVDALLRTCPELKILATSRQVLNVAGEMAWVVPSLAMPAASQTMPSQIDGYEAIQLFAERARAAQPGFTLTPENWQAVDRVCRHLDGIPLAIELAASRVKILSIGEIESHLDKRFQFLVGGNRTALPRHRTLRATMDWSYELLSEPEKVLLQRLAVFTGGFTLASATRICGQEPLEPAGILVLLSNLVDKSLLVVEEHDGTSRYRLLEMIRQYSMERLIESKDADRLYQEHLEFMLELAARAEQKLRGPEQMVWLHQLETEQENLRTALHRALENPAWTDKGRRLATLLWRYWWYRGESNEGRSWLERLLAIQSVTADEQNEMTRVEVLARLGCLISVQLDYVDARPILETSVEISRKLDHRENLAYALAWLGMLLNDQSDYALAQRLVEESIRLFREANEPWGLAYAMFVRGRGFLSLEQIDDARSSYEASVDQFRNLGDRWGLALPLGHLGVIAYHQRDYVAARRFLGERLSIGKEFQAKQIVGFALSYLALVSLRTHEEERARQFLVEELQLGQETDSKGRISASLQGFAQLAGMLEQDERAVHLFGAVAVLNQARHVTRNPQDQREYETILGQVQARMSSSDFAEAWARGQAMSLEEVIRYALEPA